MSTSSSAPANFMSRAVPAALIGLAPALMVVLPWDFGRDMSFYRGFMRGLSLTVTSLELLLIFWGAARGFAPLKAFREIPEWSKLGLALMLLVVSLGATFSALIPVLAVIGLLKIAIHFVFFLAIFDQFRNWDEKQHQIVWFAIGAGLIVYWLIWLCNIWLVNPQGDDWVLYVPGIANVRSLGFFALAGFFASIAIVTTNSTGRSGLTALTAGFAIATAALVMVLWTGSRGGVLAILAGIAFILVFCRSTRFRILKFSTLSFFAAVAISLTLPAVHPSYGIERMLVGVGSMSTDVDVSSGRLEMWQDTIAKIQERPLVGWGVDQFSVSGPERTLGYKQPHNMFLQLLFSTGALGALATLLVIGPIGARIRLNPITPENLASWGCLVGTATYGLYDAAFYYTYPVMIFLFAAATIIHSSRQKSASDKSN